MPKNKKQDCTKNILIYNKVFILLYETNFQGFYLEEYNGLKYSNINNLKIINILNIESQNNKMLYKSYTIYCCSYYL